MPKVSVIVPVYGVEKFIERCARSLFEQTLDDIEYLFVDDCSPDRSVEILRSVLEEYPNRVPQVVIHRMEQNSGQAKVREWGMRNATGEYVIHCDSDDWVDVDMYRAMYERATKDGADIVVCDYYRAWPGQLVYRAGATSSNRKSMIEDMFSCKVAWSLWNKLVKRSLYSSGIRYPVGAMGEDLLLTVQMMVRSAKVAYLPNPYYYYYQNEASITNTIVGFRVEKNVELVSGNLSELQLFLEEEGLLCVEKLLPIKILIRNQYVPLLRQKRYRKLWRRTYPEINKRVLFSKQIELKSKIGFYVRLFYSCF